MEMIDESNFSKGQIRKLNALRKSLGDTIADDAFAKWLKAQPTNDSKTDPVADKIVKALVQFENDKSVNLGRRGYVVKRARGRGASGFVVEKVE